MIALTHVQVVAEADALANALPLARQTAKTPVLLTAKEQRKDNATLAVSNAINIVATTALTPAMIYVRLRVRLSVMVTAMDRVLACQKVVALRATAPAQAPAVTSVH